ncbi:hypothetical protein [Acetobacteroides hydrogenigenes]|uniref:hypothetical protein n=1 Tax=Acetobacteroides hydrogenigenes TaxID=979970 RepID=UPI0014050812|nr:hypothetical protein [Acetobacteroides hydrogenigenes]
MTFYSLFDKTFIGEESQPAAGKPIRYRTISFRRHHGEAIPDWHEICSSERSIYKIN